MPIYSRVIIEKGSNKGIPFFPFLFSIGILILRRILNNASYPAPKGAASLFVAHLARLRVPLRVVPAPLEMASVESTVGA
ncbi:hypothetical protein HS1genome_1978 [Sulfodiicoccus acidiphilus]|uniref:Uncharacterized protein n=1 Tax=Sulfodiicoccus acidiphilus TaxID=1670455 RepID=A0A348B5Y7_9CREN|nr:hypothetical protein HS1genome_1978 [Sulfodiicoccus acidiphilus]GGU01645.1 hypothetical protein GCM10007116_18530 [Sulfodiicoccus acidiphilus]